MTSIVERKTRFHVVAYDGLDPLTGGERRRWIPIGHHGAEAEAVVARLDGERIAGPAPLEPTDKDAAIFEQQPPLRRLRDDERERFLRERDQGVLATVSPSGFPHLAPVLFSWDAAEHTVRVSAPLRARSLHIK